LARALERAKLKNLDLSHTQCGSQGAATILSADQLESLILFNNNLGSEGFHALAPALQQQHALVELDLGGNGADEASVVVLLNALIKESDVANKNVLQLLVVGGNQGGDAVEQMVAKVQRIHPGLDIARDKKAQRQTE
jgi:hypothetical protein